MYARHVTLFGVIAAAWLTTSVWASEPAGPEGAAFFLVNELRRAAGLPELAHDPLLARAAARHAVYLDRYREPGEAAQGVSAHAQHPGLDGFSGETPGDRALAAGYPHREVLENVSMGYPDAAGAIEGLMSAIYHRLTFLDLGVDELGIANAMRARVFMLGRSDVSRLCRSPPPEALSRTPVDCLGQAMTRDHYEQLCADLPAQALFRPSHPVTCPDGQRLDAGYMESVCNDPPPDAVFGGHGRYYQPCDNGTRVAAAWFDRLCERQPAQAMYQGSGHYYEICADGDGDGPRRVKAEWLASACAALPPEARFHGSGRYRRPCADGHDIRVEYLAALDRRRRDALPDMVVWPPDGAVAVAPAFFIEQPDPLPDREVSGNPVSIQFNPRSAGKIELQRFELFRVDQGKRTKISRVRLLDHASDPNKVLTTHEFALFPLQRLDWGSRYHAVIEALVDGVRRRIESTFMTDGEGVEVLRADHARQRFVVSAGRDYLLYLPPRDGQPYTVLSMQTEHLRGNRVEREVVDPNTLRVRISVRHCDHIRLRFGGGRVVILTPKGCTAEADIMKKTGLDGL